jgi:hypothetical protein
MQRIVGEKSVGVHFEVSASCVILQGPRRSEEANNLKYQSASYQCISFGTLPEHSVTKTYDDDRDIYYVVKV